MQHAKNDWMQHDLSSDLRFMALVAILSWILVTGAVWAQESGHLEGRVVASGGQGLAGVTVTLGETDQTRIADADGKFRFKGVAAGSYTLRFSLGENSHSQSVEVVAGTTESVEARVDWERAFVDSIEVYSASRRLERIAEAPAAVTVITEQQIAREAAHGQLPKLLESAPGSQVTQNGLYDFNFTSRGFNSSLSRRVLTLVDGRDVSVILAGAQEWATLLGSSGLLARVELVRGPGSALYGANAYNGVLSLITRAPRESRGGRIGLTGGELSTARFDLTYAGSLGNEWYARLNSGYVESDDFARPRTDLNGNGIPDVGTEVEYEGLDLEGFPMQRDRNEIFWGSLRLDRHLDHGGILSLELGDGGYKSGGAHLTGAGRRQTLNSERPYARINYNHPHWNFHSYLDGRKDTDFLLLSVNSVGSVDSERFVAEIQGNTGFAGGKGRIIGGVSYTEKTTDTEVAFEKIEGDFTGVFGQLEYDFSGQLRGVLSVRWDDSDLYDSQVSPRAALVYALRPRHSLRASFGKAFQAPSLSELFLQVDVGRPITAFAGLEAAFCAPNGVSCGLDVIPVKALGNPTLEVEEIEALEIGYSGVFAGRVFLTVDLYHNDLQGFISDLIPAVNPTLGILNPSFGPYQAPAALPQAAAAQLEAILRSALPNLTHHPLTQAAILKAITFTNFGEAETEGIELGLTARLAEHWSLDMASSWLGFEVKDQIEQDPLVANAPGSQFAVGLTYLNERSSVSFKYRYVEGFDWFSGLFAGPVLSYDVMDLNASYRISDQIELGINASNILDEEHYQAFGGDLIGRRILGSVGFRW